MSDVRDLNFEDVKFLFLDSEPAKEAIGILHVYGSQQHLPYLMDMLRWHGDYAIANAAERRKRASFDALLNGYSLMEIASLADYVPSKFPLDFRDKALSHLKHPALLRYYEEYYPIYLATLFRQRLEKHSEANYPPEGKYSSEIFAEFVSVTTDYQNDEHIWRFEWFLEDGFRRTEFSRKYYGLDDLIDLLARPEQLVQVLLRPNDEDLALHDAVQGFYKFLQFCRRLRGILEGANHLPLLRAGMWFHYAYWFDIIGERVSNHIKQALERFRGWPVNDEDLLELHAFVRTASTTIDYLVDKTIGEPLRRTDS
jgi:hypothetical protein